MHRLVLAITTASMLIAGRAVASDRVMSVAFDHKTDTQRSGAIIEVQEDDKPALLFGDTDSPQSMMFFWLTKEQCAGRKLRFSVMAKGIGLDKGFIFGLQASKNGQPTWPAGTGASGTFDWKPFSFSADFGALGIDSAAIRIGLQNTQGKVLFRDIKVEVDGVSAVASKPSEPVQAVVPADGVILSFAFDHKTDTQKSGAIIEVQEDDNPALLFGDTFNPQSMMFFWLTKEQCAGRKLRFSIMAKGIGLSGGFIFGLQAKKGGQLIWPGGAGASGTFDWKPFVFDADFAEIGIDAAAIRIGLQNTQGKVLFRDLKVEVLSGAQTAAVARDLKSGKNVPGYSGKFGSVDFSANRFHVPDFNASRNLIQNPSFEAGTDFWTPTGYSGSDGAMRADGAPLIALDATTAFDGRHSLRQEVIEGTAHPPATFAIPVDEGAEYTLSFYAKTDSPDTAKFSAGGMTDVWDTFLKPMRFRLGTEWKRYSYTFTAPKKMVQLFIGCARGATPCRVWIDAVQLEKGAQATEFTRLPATVSLISSTRDNLSEPGTPAGIRLLVNSTNPVKGTLRYAIRNFFGTVVASDTAPFETREADVPVEFSIPACDALPSGAYVVESRIILPDGFVHSAWHRFVRMRFMDGTHKHKAQFSAAGIHALGGDWETVINLFKRMGVGSSCIFETPPKQYQDLLRKYDIAYYTELFRHSGWPATIDGLPYHLKSSVTRGQTNGVAFIPDDAIPLLVEHALKTIAMNPDCTAFKTINEPFAHTEAEIARTVEILKTIRTAVQKVHPDIRIMTPDCANIDHSMSYLETFFKHGGAEACDIVAVHLYRGHPDGMDADVTKLLGLIDRYKPGAELWSTEGGYFNTYIIPDIGFPVVSHGGDHYRTGNMSYDLGLGERIATAYQTRYRIQSLKHADRLKVDQDWNLISDWRTYFGLDAIPLATVFATSTLAQLLGNADFVSDLKLPKDLRGYLFKDEQDRPVAALWFNNGDNLYKTLPPAQMDMAGFGEFEAFDMMCAPVAAQDGILDVSGYPVFIRGKTGTADAMQKTIESAAITLPEFGDALGFSFDLKPDGSFQAKFANRFNRPLKGVLSCTSGGETLLEKALDLKPYEAFESSFAFPAATGSSVGIPFNYTFKPDQGSTILKSIKLQYTTTRKVDKDAFRIDGNAAKWESIPGLRADNVRRSNPAGDVTGDFEVETKWTWNEDMLYLAVFVKDDDFSPSKTIQFPDMGDAVTIYFDSFADKMRGAGSGESGTNEDDHDYMLWLRDDGKVDMIRRRCAHWQLSFSKPGTVGSTQSHYEKTPDGYWMELAVPMIEVKPIELKNGGVFGMNVVVNDYDGGKSAGSAYYGDGDIPVSWRSPQDYVFMFLSGSRD